MHTYAIQKLSGWGRFPVEESHVYRPEKRRDAVSVLTSAHEPTLIPRGLGRSYGDTALNRNQGVLDYSRLNRMLDFDAETGILECESGVSLAEILDAFVPKGFFLSVLPGTKFVTVGGAIANDVHGKNHHRDGAFSAFVESLELLLPSGETLTCSPAENADVFWATAGGIGLTGLILTARIRLQPVASAYMLVDLIQTHDIEDTLGRLSESDKDFPYSVAWIDCLAKGPRLGRSVLMLGKHAGADALPRTPARRRAKPELAVPFDFPGFVLNRWTIAAFNRVFYTIKGTVHGKLMHYDAYFCPLDAIHHWNRMYGRRGFVQFQATFPFAERAGLVRLLERVSASSAASFLAVLKRFGPAGPGLLSYPFEGYTITFDIPMRRDLLPLLQEFERLLLEHGGRIYLAKDAVTQPESFAAMYPNLDAFRAIKERLDPGHRLSSSMARRLGIVSEAAGETHGK